MGIYTFLKGLSIRSPCKKCLIQACCTEECGDFTKWIKKFNFLNDVIDIILLLSGIGVLFILAFMVSLHIVNIESADKVAYKIERIIQKRTRRNYNGF